MCNVILIMKFNKYMGMKGSEWFYDILSGITIEFDRLQAADQKHHRPKREKTTHFNL